MSFGPRQEPGTGQGQVPVAEAAEDATWAAQQAFHLGVRQAVTDPERGFALGHDVASGADTEHRGFVHAVKAGWQAGLQAKAELVEQAKAAQQAADARAVRERLAERQAAVPAACAESEQEAEAG